MSGEGKRPLARPKAGVVLAAATVIAALLLTALASPAEAISRKQAEKRALRALKVESNSKPVMVFRERRTVRAGTRIREAGATRARSSRILTPRQERARRNRLRRTGVTSSRGRTILTARERSYMFYADFGPHQAYQHPGRVVLVGVRSGRVRRSRVVYWPPVIRGRLPVFLRSPQAYGSRRHRVFSRDYTANSPPAPAGRRVSRDAFGGIAALDPAAMARMQRVADLLAAEGSCAVRLSDTLGDFGDWIRTDLTRAAIGRLLDQLEILNPAFIHERYSTRSGRRPAAFVESMIARGCRDVLIYVAGSGYRGGGDPVVSLGTKPRRNGRVETQDLTRVDLARLFRANSAVTFKLLIDAPFAGEFITRLRNEPNVLIVQTASGPRDPSFGFLPGIVRDGTFVRNADNPLNLLEFTNRILMGLDRFLADSSRIEQGADLQAQGRIPSFMAYMLGRAFDDSRDAGLLDELLPAGASQFERNPVQLGPQDPGQGQGPPPVAQGQTVTTNEDTSVVIDLSNGNASDRSNAFAVTQQPQHGTLTGSGHQRTYTPNPDYNGPDSFAFNQSRGNQQSNGATVNITVNPINDGPIVNTTAGATDFTEGGGPVIVDGGLTVSDIDSPNLDGATVGIASGHSAADDSLGFTPLAGVTGNYNAATGVLTFTGSAPVADYQTLLRSVTFDNGSANPSLAARELEFRVTDDGGANGGPATKQVNVIGVNDPPVLTTTGGTTAYTENDPATPVDTGLTVSDVDSPNLDGATVSITNNFAGAEDRLDFTDQNGITGSYNAGTGVLTLTGSSSVANYQTALRSVGYRNTSDDPSGLTRTVSFHVTDDGALMSTTETQDVSVTPVNDAPVAVDGADLSVTEESLLTFLAPGILANDTDPEGDALSVSEVDGAGANVGVERTLASGAKLKVLSDGRYEYDPRTGHNGLDDGEQATDTFTYRANDGALDSNEATVEITVFGVNDSPTLATSAGTTAYSENDPPTAVDSGLTAADPEDEIDGATVQITGNLSAAQDRLRFTDQNGISGSYNTADGKLTLTGTTTVANYQTALRSVAYENLSDNPSTATRTVSFQITDGGGLTSTVETKDVSVTAVNDAPTAVDGANLSTTEDSTLTFLAPGILANDTDPEGDALTVSEVDGAAANVGTQFTTANGAKLKVFSSGRYEYDPTGALDHLKPGQQVVDSFTYRANDGSLDSNLATVEITVHGVNDAPTAAADTYDGVGNTALHVDESRTSGQAGKEVTGDILGNDTDPDHSNAELSATAETKATTGGGSVTIDTDGSFTFHPDDGDTTDSFSYTVTDGTDSDTGTVTINMSGEVWFVDNSAAPGGDGTSDGPFDTLAEADTASGAGDHVFVFDGDNTNTGLNSGISLENNQTLLGERADLVVGGHTLYNGVSGNRPSIGNGAGDGITLASGNTIRGLDIDAPSDTAIIGSSPAGGTFDDLEVGGRAGIDLGTTSGTFTFSDLDIDTNGSGSAFEAGGTGSLSFDALSTINIDSVGGKALDLTGNALSGSIDGLSVSSSPSGGIEISNTSGSFTIGNLGVTTSGGTGIWLSNATSINLPTSATVSSTGGPGIDLQSSTGTFTFSSVSSTNSASDGINLSSMTPNVTVNGGSIAGAGDRGVDISGGSGAFFFSGTVGNGSGEAVRVQSKTGGAVTFTGSITDTTGAAGIDVLNNSGGSTTFSGSSKQISSGAGHGIDLQSNGGHSITFSGGGLDIDSTSGRGFSATGGGTINVTGAANTIDSTTGTGLHVKDTTIGSSDLTFQRISHNGGSNGIMLDSTGTGAGNGGLTVTGTGTAGSGGTIQNTTGSDDAVAGNGVYLKDTRDVSLSRMQINDHQNFGIRGLGVVNFDLLDSVVSGTNGNSNAADEAAIGFGKNDGITIINGLTGQASIQDSNVQGGHEDNLSVRNNSGTLNRLVIDDSTFGANATASGNDSILLEPRGTATLNVDVTDTAITAARGDLLQVNVVGGSGASSDVDIHNTDFSNNHPNIVSAGGGVTLSSTGSLTYDISRTNPGDAATANTFRDALGSAIVLFASGSNADMSGRVEGNAFGVSGGADASAQASGIAVDSTLAGDHTALIKNNTIFGFNEFGVHVRAGDTGGVDPDIDYTVEGNTVGDPLGFALNAIHLNNGTTSVDNFVSCVDIKSNSVAGAAGVGADDIRVRQRQSTGVRLPGYTGANNDNAAVVSYLLGRNTASTASAANTVAGTGQGFLNTIPAGSACTQP